MRYLHFLLAFVSGIGSVQADNIIRTPAPINLSSSVVSPPETPDEPGDLEFSLLALTLPQAKVGHPYNYGLRSLIQWQSTADSRPLSWTSTSLQDGLSIAGEQITGTPTVGGTQLIDLKGSLDSVSASANYVLNIIDLKLNPIAPQTTMAGKAFDLNLVNQVEWLGLASGQSNPLLTWKVATDSSLPPGLTLSNAGQLSGTPSLEGDYSLKVESSNSDFTKTLDIPLNVDISSISAIQIAAGSSNTCALTTSKTVKCWGYNGFNGDGTSLIRSTPVDVLNISGAKYITYGYSHGCAITEGGSLYCWGENGYRQIGNGSSTDALVPYQHTNLGIVKSVDVGRYHTCASNTAGELYCWGHGGNGRLGNGSTTAAPTPYKVNIPEPVTQVATSANSTYALTSSGKIYGFGYSTTSTAILPGYTSTQSSPVSLSLGSDNIKVEGDFDDNRACVLKSNKTLTCFGDLPGNGTSSGGHTLVQVALNNVEDVAMGGASTCATLSSGGVRCWGDNESYKLNNGGNQIASIPTTPIHPALLSNVRSISTGTAHACSVSKSGTTRCWGTGSNYRTGFGSTTLVTTPMPVIEP